MYDLKRITFFVLLSLGISTTSAEDCLPLKNNVCRNLPNGDYNVCEPECSDGSFITCSNNVTSFRTCATGWYSYPNGTRYLAPTVFDPNFKNCQFESPFCRR